MVVMPKASERATARFGPSPSRRVTGRFASWWRERANGRRLLDAEVVRVQGLASVVDLACDVGAVLGEPLGDAPGVAGRRPLALDEGDDLVLVAHQPFEQPGGGVGEGRGHRPDAVAGDAQVVALGDGADVAGAGPHG